MNENTRDLMDYRHENLKMAGKLLYLYRTPKDNTKLLGYPISVEYNPESKVVFLVDDQCHTAMLNGEVLEDWLVCLSCQAEGFRDDMAKGNACCKHTATLGVEELLAA